MRCRSGGGFLQKSTKTLKDNKYVKFGRQPVKLLEALWIFRARSREFIDDFCDDSACLKCKVRTAGGAEALDRGYPARNVPIVA